MKNKKVKTLFAALGLFTALICSSANAKGQQLLCKWDNRWQWCFTSASDGLCAYGGDSCQSTIPTVE